MKKLSMVLLALCLSLALAQTKVTFWSSVVSEPMQVLIDRFNAEQSEIQVEIVDAGSYNDMITRLQAGVVSKRLPDVVMLEITRYGIFADRGVLEPLTEFLTDPGFNQDDLVPGIRAATLYKGTPYVIPFNNSVPVMYYNKDLLAEAGFDAPPATWEDLLSYAQALTKRDASGNVTQWGVSAPPQWVRHAFVKQNEGDWMTEDETEFTLNQPEALEAYQFLYDLIYTHEVASVEAAPDANDNSIAQPAFTSGQTAIYFGSTGSLGGISSATEFDLGVAALPCNKVCAAPIGGATLGIIADSPNKEATWAFISWMTKTDNNAFWHTQTGYMPIRFSTLEEQSSQDFYRENPNFKVAIDQFQADSFPRSRPPAMSAIRELELTTWEEIVTQSKTVEQALEDLTKEANILLSNN